MSEKILPGNVGVEGLADMADVSRPTAFRWARGAGAPAGFPQPVHLPGKPQQWPQSAVEQWLASFDAVRNTERAMEAFADSEELDPLLRSIARTARRRLASMEFPIGVRKKLADVLNKVRWERGTEALSPEDKRRARKLLLQLLALGWEPSK
jgi:predicted DNA-binding transcriptional regulator AlpA